MTKPKTVRMWACYTPKGTPILSTLSTRKDRAKSTLCSRYGLDPITLFVEEGYSVRRVTITPEDENKDKGQTVNERE